MNTFTWIVATSRLAFVCAVVAVFASGAFGEPGSTLGRSAESVSEQPTPPSNAQPCTFCPEVSPPDCKGLCIEENPLYVVGSDGSAAGVVRACNKGDQPIPLDLRLADFISSGGHPVPLGTTRTLSDATGKPIPEALELKPGACTDVKVAASKLWQAGLVTAELYNGRTRLITLKAIRHDVPFNIKVDGPTPESVEISFKNENTSYVRLRNEDPMTYRFLWRFYFGDQLVGEGTATAQPGGEVTLPVTLGAQSYSFLESGFLRSGASTGRLVLEYEPDPSFRALPLPRKVYPVSATLSYWGDVGQGFWNTASILVLLTIGILVSLAINFALPMQRKRIALKQRLADLEGRLAGLGPVVDSRILSLLRSEKRRLRDELHGLWPFFPETENALLALGSRIDWLERRIDLTVRAGEHLTAIEFDTDLAQAEAELVRACCHQVLSLVEMAHPKPEDVQRAEEQLELALGYLNGARQPPTPEMVEALRKRVANLPDNLVSDPGCSEDLKPFDELLQALRKDYLKAEDSEPTRGQYVRASRAVRKAELITEFARLLATSGGSDVLKGRLKRATDLLQALLPGKYESVRHASDVVRQIEQNVGKDDLLSEIKSGGNAMLSIEVDPPTPIAHQLVTFRARLDKPGYDAAFARREIECHWNIGGLDLEARDWTVCDYFPRPSRDAHGWGERFQAWKNGQTLKPARSRDVSVELRHGGAALMKSGPITVELEPLKSYGESSTIYSVVTLGITVVVVGFGLLAAAQEKIQALDWVAGLGTVLLLGIGADVLKRVMSKP